MRSVLVAGLCALGLLLIGPEGARADYDHYDLAVEPEPEPGSNIALELALEVGLFDRGTTGVGDPLLDYGYDHGGGPAVGARLRFLSPLDDRYFHHGIDVRLLHQAGGTLGLSEEVGFYWTEVATGYGFRTMFPCMSNESDGRIVRFTGTIGLTVANANAGTGRAARDDRWNERVAASEQLDHMAVGPHVSLGLDYHIDDFLIGIAIDARQLFSVSGGVEARTFGTSATLRTGVDLDL